MLVSLRFPCTTPTFSPCTSTNLHADIDEHEDEEDPLCPVAPQGRRILWDYIILDEGHKVRGCVVLKASGVCV